MHNTCKTKLQLQQELLECRQRIRELEELHEAYRKMNERYREFFENAEDGCFEIDLQGKFLLGNKKAYDILGYSQDEYEAISNEKRHPTKEEAIRVFEAFSEVYKTGKPLKDFEYQVVMKGGEIVTGEVTVSLIRDADGRPAGFRGIGRDVTERKKIEVERERYREFFENVEDACFESDLEGNIIFCNEALRRLTGYTLEELRQLGPEGLHPKDAERLRQTYESIYRTGHPASIFDYEMLCKDGTIRKVQSSVSLIRDRFGKPVGYRGIGRDVKDRMKVEEEQARYRDFLENIEDGCFEVDLSGNFTFSNDAAARRFGYEKEEIIGMNNRRYMSHAESKRVYKIFHEVYQTGEPSKVFDLEIFTGGNEPAYLELSVSLIRDARGKPVGFRGISRDITERRRLTEQLIQAQKLEAVGTLAGGLAHDFNNLLMGIQGYVSLVLLETEPSHPNHEKLRAIETQVKSGADLTRQLLGYARSGRYEVTPVDMNDLIIQTTAMFGRTKKELRIHQLLAPDLWSVEADRGQMEQVLLNLFINAWQAMPGGGVLYLETANTVLNETNAEMYDVSSGPYVQVSVTDTGTGLGLASVYGIVRGHKGTIHVYSEKGHGSSFHLYLPASDKSAVIVNLQENPVARGHETILLVDDERMITDVTGALIEGMGYQVIIANSCEEACAVFKEKHDQIDLVIMDMIMPGEGGAVAIDKMLGVNPGVKIILSSGYSLNGEAKHIVDRGGARAFLQKPFSFDALSQKIREVLES